MSECQGRLVDDTSVPLTHRYQTKPYKVHEGVGEANYTPEELLKMSKAVKEAGFSAMMVG